MLGIYPSEEVEQVILANWLDWRGVPWCHVPNGGERNARVGKRLKGQGVKRGVPDVLIFASPTGDPGYCGVAIELKSMSPKARLSKEQKQWLDTLRHCGWYTLVCRGAMDAIEALKGLGY